MALPTEDVCFEGRATGWPPLTRWSTTFYLPFLVPILWLAAFDGTVPVTLAGTSVPIPVVAFFVPVVVIGELWRYASFQSTVYVITATEVVRFGGVFLVGRISGVWRAEVVDVELVRGDPVLSLPDKRRALVGLGAANLDPVRLALGFPALNKPILPARRRGRIVVGVVVALCLLAQAFGACRWRARRELDLNMPSLRSAFVAATTAFDARHKRETLFPGTTTTSFYHGTWDDTTSFVDGCHCWRMDDGGDDTVYVDAHMKANVLGVRVLVVEYEPLPRNAEFLADLRRAFAERRIEATWPE